MDDIDKENNEKEIENNDSESETNSNKKPKATKIKRNQQQILNLKYIDDKPYTVIPDWAEISLKNATNSAFKDVKFILHPEDVETIPHLLDFMFDACNLKNVNDHKIKQKRTKMWMPICKYVHKEINKMRSNKITAYYTVLKGNKK